MTSAAARPPVVGTRPRVGRLLGVLVVLLLSGLPLATPAAAADVVARPADGVLVLDGRGFGHGRGMSQYGAHGAARRGLGYAQVLAHYYRGAVLASEPGRVRRVLVTGEDSAATVTNAAGLRLRNEASGATLDVGRRGDWSQVRVRADGSVLRAEALQGGSWVPAWPAVTGPVAFEGPATVALHHPAGVRGYRGALVDDAAGRRVVLLRAALSGQAAKPLYVVNVVGLDDYVRGVVPAEMPASWHREALKAQAVAARSYGLQPCPQPRTYPTTRLYDVIDTTACQVYSGTSGEAPATNQAVTDTAGRVLKYGGAVLRTEFSASNGGWSVAAGGPFVAASDPYDGEGAAAVGRSEVHRWSGVRVPVGTLERAFGTGRLRELRVLARDGNGEWGGRVLRVRLVGDSRTVEVTGAQVRSAAGLRSDWFDVRGGGGSAIDAKHGALGGDNGLLGAAVSPEADAAGGRYRVYQRGAIYWSPATRAHEVHGAIADRWAGFGWEHGFLGYPVTDELVTPDGTGRYNHFQGGSVYWSPRTGAREVHGAIGATWGRLGYERGVLGYPVTDETATADGRGRRGGFQRGAVYWSPSTGAHEVYGAIADRWSATGAERGSLGYPVSGEYPVPGGRRGDFQRGSVLWDARTGTTTVVGR